MPPDYSLSEEQKQHFLEHGFIKLEDCFSPEDEFCKGLMDRVWERLDMDPNDKETWNPWRVHLPRYHDAIPMRDFCPKAWSAICELCGGEDRIDTADEAKWKAAAQQGLPSGPDNLTPAQEKLLDPHDRDNWHVDGDFFHHFLDSKEQALLPIVLFKDIKVGGGGTMICPDAIPTMAEHLAAHPEGLMPDMTFIEGREKLYKDFDHGFFDEAVKPVPKDRFRTATGKAGDIYLLHPLMVHSAAPNYLREPRFITNPPVALKQPFNFDRTDGSAYSLVEQKTLNALGHPEGLKGWKITTERKLIVPERVREQAQMKKI
ncbi:uncharacterized protein M437DRAFT_43740 [Aureobasidium melanogenum CBS 110374]|uniref:Phytanoyl-CoA dioxygenase n=1 Tax=Aureobasidium melanogenum (strain CBS 110374) TaxID=1043003 RepID=A0A074VVW7_AURM1|nr:uncharacterized protein M437DRAFT_43740 [Aureobasidium melanogenum CBS 110374]KEQ64593.1 hypothetical protein M437DRAFT_43740 [Aureobasidium melanogenum CBS 110374]